MSELLTFHPDRLDRLLASRRLDGDDLAGHFLLAYACDEEVITWDRTVWGDLMFGVNPYRSDPRDLHPSALDIWYMVSDFGPAMSGQIEPPILDTLTPDELDRRIEEFNDMTAEEQRNLPSEFPDPTHQRAEYLRLVVTGFNKLHDTTERMVASWPANTGHPLAHIRNPRND